jgi:hypothetical protein
VALTRVVASLGLMLCLAAVMASAQSDQNVPASNVTTKSVAAIGYKIGGGSTKVGLVGTELMSQAGGQVRVEAKAGVTRIEPRAPGRLRRD